MLQLKNLFNRKLTLASIILTSLWMIDDFSQRFTEASKRKNMNVDQTILTELTPTGITEQQKNQIITLYQQYRINAADNIPKKQQGLTAKQQTQQQGLLKQLFIGDYKLELKAVISKASEGENSIELNSARALLRVSNIISGDVKIEAFANYSQVFGYRMLIEKNTQVTLSRLLPTDEAAQADGGAQTVATEQVITLTMYQPIAQTSTENIKNNESKI